MLDDMKPIIIKLQDAYQYYTSTICQVRCSKCNKLYDMKNASIRIYQQKHKNIVCRDCTAKERGVKLRKVVNRNSKISCKCHYCQKEIKVKIKNAKANARRNNGIFSCVACSLKKAHQIGKFDIYTPEFKAKLYDSGQKFWLENRGKWKEWLVTPAFRQEMSIHGKRAWSVDEYRKKMLATCSTPEFKARHSEWAKRPWTDISFRTRFSQKMKEVWQDTVLEN